MHNPDRPVTQPGGSGAERQRADSARRARRRSERLLNRRGVTFMARPEGETAQ